MHIQPSLSEVLSMAESGQAALVTLSLEILSDFTTPIETLRILKALSTQCFLLESAKADEEWGRYTFLGLNPRMNIIIRDTYTEVDGLPAAGKPADILRTILQNHRSLPREDLPPFTGGLVGYFGFDYFGCCEPAAKAGQTLDPDAVLARLMLFDEVICFDHIRQKMILMKSIPLDHPEEAYERARYQLKWLCDLLHHGPKARHLDGRLEGEATPLFDQNSFGQLVLKAKHHIFEGDVFQIVLSNEISAPFSGSLFPCYRQLRTINPSPYMFYLAMDDFEAAGASPETLVRLENRTLHTFPLAGTRPRARDRNEDLALEKELLADEKELAEHDMLVDLGRNDLGRVSVYGSVEVERLHSIERFSHVMHIGSSVRSLIREDQDALDALGSVLPAGTLSGAPKIRACQLIHELEQNPRSMYGGAAGYIDFSGNMDLCIAIRLLFKENGRIHIRSGAGIVADSDPEKEYQECLNKAKSSLAALQKAEEEETCWS